jgi:hypothetical protein
MNARHAVGQVWRVHAAMQDSNVTTACQQLAHDYGAGNARAADNQNIHVVLPSMVHSCSMLAILDSMAGWCSHHFVIHGVSCWGFVVD